MLEILQRGGTRTVAELAERLDVDERTVRRYVDHLLDLDIPVRSVRGRHGGYRLSPGYRMPPLMLTDEEALAVLLGLVAGRRPNRSSPSSHRPSQAGGDRSRHFLGAGPDTSATARMDTTPAGSLDRPFVVEQPDALRDLVRALAGRLADHADARGD